MFHFRFDLDDGVDEACASVQDAHEHRVDTASPPQQTDEPFSEIDPDSLLKALPTQISYSFLSIPSSDDHSPDPKIARRDLFDARFQLISEGTTDDSDPAGQVAGSNPGVTSALEFIDNPSDLVPFVYEGGLKTWECSIDLASCLKRDGHAANAKGRRVLELGCGTAIPTLCVLQELFSSPPTDDTETHIHLQDYNVSVLQLVTMPNVLLSWYTSPAANAYRTSDAHTSEAEHVDLELLITPQLLGAFRASLRVHRVHLRFFSGAWDSFDIQRTGGPYHLVLTSETIYHTNTLPSLVRVLLDACTGGHAYLCLVAGKTVYFGVGGGVAEFVRCVESTMDERGSSGQVETIWEKATGVSRKVMRLRWA
ncbi:hypothetical protein L210DRAFT_3623553 [Boletus edulis BED1]|uniref:protein-histidine N-methyltransferase n=1 Tax=Boletus edulis BED1 TaxID=1328754 RepID=A0AAD4BIA4_BOLED|nr:hypothetical protein L210DRAFT_3623553 [Boletus edulis BED1]